MTHLNAALVVGASASIGPAIATAFAGAARSVIATYHSNAPALSAPGLEWLPLDITDAASRAGLHDNLVRRGLTLDAVIFVAGIISGKALEAYTDEMAAHIVDVNFTGQGLLARDLAPLMSAGGRMLFVSSIAAERGSFDPFYAASKGAMLPFVKSLATAYGKTFSVNAVLPGPIADSTMYDEMAPAVRERHLEQSPRKALLEADDLAQILVDMTRPHWCHANGVVLRLNGGSYV